MQHDHVESHARGCRQAVNHHAQLILGQRQVDERIEERCHGRAARCQADDFLLALAVPSAAAIWVETRRYSFRR
jgi:hypothetical protein